MQPRCTLAAQTHCTPAVQTRYLAYMHIRCAASKHLQSMNRTPCVQAPWMFFTYCGWQQIAIDLGTLSSPMGRFVQVVMFVAFKCQVVLLLMLLIRAMLDVSLISVKLICLSSMFCMQNYPYRLHKATQTSRIVGIIVRHSMSVTKLVTLAKAFSLSAPYMDNR